jgi:ubiquinone/menaquinone biosynthesis C-methylase UbiE
MVFAAAVNFTIIKLVRIDLNLTRMKAAIFHKSVLVKNSDVSKQSWCPFCGNSDLKTLAIEESIEINGYWLECSQCYLVFANQMPSNAFLTDYYSNYYVDSTDSKTTFNNINRLADRIYRKARLDRFKDMAEINILDWGGGDGSVSFALAERHFPDSSTIFIDNVDYHADVIDIQKVPKNISYTSLQNLADADKKYDLIICSAILEHVPSIRENIDILIRQLKSGGAIYFRTPFMMPFKKILKSRLNMTYPAHVFDIGRGFYSQLLNRYGLKKLYLGPSIIETTLKQNPTRTLTAFLLKFPAYFLPEHWPFIGGCELVATKN